MGCDIHFRVEYQAKSETLVARDGDLKIAPTGPVAWHPAERVTENKDRLRWLAAAEEKRVAGQQEDAEAFLRYAAEEPEMTVNYEDLFYTGRDYRLFERLSGVRGAEHNSIMFRLNRDHGLPPDCSPEIAEELSEDDGDLHSHTWLLLSELEAQDWSDAGWSFFRETLDLMRVVAIEKCDGDTTRVRAVMAYDN